MSATARLEGVLIAQMEQVPSGQLYLPLPASTQLRVIARQLAQAPNNRSTLEEWASSAMG